MKIAFIGTGYVGLVSGVMMSHLGHDVLCIDVDPNKIELLKQGKAPIFEPGLDEYIAKYANSDRLQFTCDYDDRLSDVECLFITVGTPPEENGSADLSGVFDCLASALKYINSGCVVAIKSTVPPGTCKTVANFIKSCGRINPVASNPEFLREGSAIIDFLEPDRVVIGTNDDLAFEIMRDVYKPLTDKNIKLVESDLNTSELIKYGSNTFLANKIAFINEMADLCEAVGADIDKFAQGIGLDHRIGSAFLKAGPGFGGSCFPKDILALQQLCQSVDSESLILNAVIKANDDRANKMLNKIKFASGKSLNKQKIAVLGLTYKAGTDDLRSSPAISLINNLTREGAIITAYDPEGMPNVPKYFKRLNCAESMYDAVKDADIIVIITEWPEFKEIDLSKVKKLARGDIFIDLRNILSRMEVNEAGFRYYSIGRKGD